MSDPLTILSVNLSEKTGTVKHSVEEADLTSAGVAGDAHAGPWNRQVSLLGKESIVKFERETGRKIQNGDFAENLTTEGIALWKLNPLDRFLNDTIELEVTQIGKECRGTSCTIFREVGDCVMPKEGIFCRVIKPGKVYPGLTLDYHPKTFRILVITLSDRASSGIYEDKSGPRIRQLCEEFFSRTQYPYEVRHSLIPDDPDALKSLIIPAREEAIDFIFTTGGTGIGPKDMTTDVIKSMIDKEIPGIMEMIRMKFGTDKPGALLSRSIAGTLGSSLIYSLPGSLKAVNEYMPEIFKTILHAKFMLHQLDFHG